MFTFYGDSETPYYEKLITNTHKSLANIVTVGERLEMAIKFGKIESRESSSFKKNVRSKRKESEADAVTNYLPYGQPY